MRSTCIIVCASCAVALSIAGCEGDRRSRSPLAPNAIGASGGASSIIRLELQGPEVVPPGSSARFSVVAVQANGGTRDVTADVLWHSTTASVLSIDGSGLATGHQRGESRLSASQGLLGVSRDIVVVPEGTYRLAGIVNEAGAPQAPLQGALVEVTAGTGAGLSMTTGSDGRYRLYGVSGAAELRVTRDGYVARTLSVLVSGHTTEDVELPLAQQRPDVSGTYTLTLSVSPACADAVPEAIRARSYTAVITQQGPRLNVKLSGAEFALSLARRGDNFHGRLDPEGLRFTLASHAYRYYSYAQYPDIVEKLPNSAGYFVLAGTAFAPGAGPVFSGRITGEYQHFKFDPAWGGSVSTECRGEHQFVLSRIGE